MSFRQTDDDQIRSLCGALAVVRQKSHWIITINVKINVWTCELIFPTDPLQQKIEITDIWVGGGGFAETAKSVHKVQNSQRRPWPPLYIIRGNLFSFELTF